MENWQTVIPHHENVLEDIHIVGDRVLASHLVKASSSLTLFELDGNNAKSVELPELEPFEIFEPLEPPLELSLNFPPSPRLR